MCFILNKNARVENGVIEIYSLSLFFIVPISTTFAFGCLKMSNIHVAGTVSQIFDYVLVFSLLKKKVNFYLFFPIFLKKKNKDPNQKSDTQFSQKQCF